MKNKEYIGKLLRKFMQAETSEQQESEIADYFCHSKWGEASSYDLCIDSGKLGIDGTVDFIEDFVRSYLKKRDGE